MTQLLRQSRLLILLAVVILYAPLAATPAMMAAGDVVVMPDRDALMGTSLVVWGNTNPANAGAAYTISFGDATPNAVGVVGDPSYIAVNHTYASAGVFTATMTIGGDSDSVAIEVFDGGALTAENARNIGINMAIEDGLRNLYFQQYNRAATYGTPYTSWTGHYDIDFHMSWTSLALLALENHGHTVLDDPTQDIFQPVVQRGLNFIFNNLSVVTLGVQPSGDPCVGVPADANVCVGLGQNKFNGHSMYASSVITLAVAGSGAPSAVVGAGIGAANGFFVAGRTYGEILQRQVNTITWGLNDGAGSPWGCAGASQAQCLGGFGYVLNGDAWGTQYSDGSTAGWGVLALLDGEAAGATVPAWAKSDITYYLSQALNTDSSLKYQLYMGNNQSNFAKTGIGLEVMAFTGRPSSNADVVAASNLLGTTWAGGFSSDGFNGSNKGHAYGMFNAFKGLKLFGIQTLAGVGRPAGPGSIPANDWHADYQDWLVANQSAPNTPSGGDWNFPNGWSYPTWFPENFGAGTIGYTAVAELILSPVALVLPAHLTLSPATATNPVGTTHTVTAVATSVSGSFVAGATVTFTVVSGPNAGQTGTGVTNASGEATWTYTDTGGAGTDTIKATIGSVESNTVSKIWKNPNDPPTCSATPDVVTLWPPNHQLVLITLSGATDPNGDPITYTADSIYQDEPLTGSGQGAGNTPWDATLSPVQVRAERNGNPKTPGNGRVYYINFTASDPAGEFCTGQVQVCVPHDQGGSSSCVADGPNVKSTQ